MTADIVVDDDDDEVSAVECGGPRDKLLARHTMHTARAEGHEYVYEPDEFESPLHVCDRRVPDPGQMKSANDISRNPEQYFVQL